MNYNDIGYDNYLLRPLEATYTEQAGIESSSSLEQISGSQIKGDSLTSVNQTLSLNLESDSFTVKDGEINRIEIGRLSDGTIGLIIRDNQGNEMLHISPEVNKLTSVNGNLEIDFLEERLIVYDEGKTPRILLGKQVGGF